MRMLKAWVFSLLIVFSFLTLISFAAFSAVTVSVNGSNHTIPQTNEKGWGNNVTAWIQAISSATLQKNGGTFTLTNDVDFGSSKGLKAPYYLSKALNPATTGVLRLGNTQSVSWRNQANGGNLPLAVDATDALTFNGGTIAVLASNVLPGEIAAAQVTSGTFAQARLGTYLGSIAGAQVDSGTIATAVLGSIPFTSLNGTISIAQVGDAGSAIQEIYLTVPSFLSVSGSPLEASGTLAVSLSGTALPVANGGTGVTVSSGASSLMLRDSNQNTAVNSITQNYASLAATGGAIILTAGSAHFNAQTGNNNQIWRLPDATTLTLGERFTFLASAAYAGQLQNGAGSIIHYFDPGDTVVATVTNIGSQAGTWAIENATRFFKNASGINNLSIYPAVSANALTVNIRDSGGISNPTSTYPVSATFLNSADLVTGGLQNATMMSSFSATIPSGATLGCSDGVACYIYVYLMNVGQQLVVAVSGYGDWDESALHSTTALSTGSDSSNVLYTTSGQTNRTIRLIGRILITQATAGTWASAPTSVYQGFVAQKIDKGAFKAAGDILYGLGNGQVGTLTAGDAGKFLQSNGAAAPSWETQAGPGAPVVSTKTANFIATTDDLYIMNITNGLGTLATAGTSKIQTFVNINATGGTLYRAGSDLIYPGGTTQIALPRQYDSVTLQSDGDSKWFVVSSNLSATFFANTSTTAGSDTTRLIFTNEVDDSHSGYNPSDGTYTIPPGMGGLWYFSATAYYGASESDVNVHVNGTRSIQGAKSVANSAVAVGGGHLRVSAGDIIDVRPGGSVTASGNSLTNVFSGHRVGK